MTKLLSLPVVCKLFYTLTSFTYTQPKVMSLLSSQVLYFIFQSCVANDSLFQPPSTRSKNRTYQRGLHHFAFSQINKKITKSFYSIFCSTLWLRTFFVSPNPEIKRPPKTTQVFEFITLEQKAVCTFLEFGIHFLRLFSSFRLLHISQFITCKLVKCFNSKVRISAGSTTAKVLT